MFTVTSSDTVAKCKELKQNVYTDSGLTTLFTSSSVIPESLVSTWTFSNPTTVSTATTQNLVFYVEVYFVWLTSPAVTDKY